MEVDGKMKPTMKFSYYSQHVQAASIIGSRTLDFGYFFEKSSSYLNQFLTCRQVISLHCDFIRNIITSRSSRKTHPKVTVIE